MGLLLLKNQIGSGSITHKSALPSCGDAAKLRILAFPRYQFRLEAECLIFRRSSRILPPTTGNTLVSPMSRKDDDCNLDFASEEKK